MRFRIMLGNPADWGKADFEKTDWCGNVRRVLLPANFSGDLELCAHSCMFPLSQGGSATGSYPGFAWDLAEAAECEELPFESNDVVITASSGIISLNVQLANRDGFCKPGDGVAVFWHSTQGQGTMAWLSYEGSDVENADRRKWKCPLLYLKQLAHATGTYRRDHPRMLAAADFSVTRRCVDRVPAGSTVQGCDLWDEKSECWETFDAWEKTQAAANKE